MFYGFGAILMLIAYRYGELSTLQPILSMNYVLSLIFAKVFLNETIITFHVIGIFIIVFGVVLIGGSDE